MNTITREEISGLVFESIDEYQEIYGKDIDLSRGEETRLFGGDQGALDSLGLVSLVVKIEEDVEEEFDVSISLTSEKAMSRRTSPFARIEYLIDYIEELIAKSK